MSESLAIHGGCHCGAISYELTWPLDNGEQKAVIPARKCGCTFCTRIDGRWTSHPDATLTISESPELPATRYRFGTATADFIFCSRCGIAPLVTCEIEGRLYAVVNVNTFTPTEMPTYRLELENTDFDGETRQNRLERRAARWIGDVRAD